MKGSSAQSSRPTRGAYTVLGVAAIVALGACAGGESSGSPAVDAAATVDAATIHDAPTPTDAASCPSGTVACGLDCVEVAIDERHCGACDHGCGDGLACGDGHCTIAMSGDGGGRWRYRRAIAITGSIVGPQVDYVVPVVVDTRGLVEAGTLQATGADLRFAAADGIELPWWTASNVISDQATLWLRVPAIPVGGAIVYLYYGNPAASAGWSWNSGPRTFDFFDDFEGAALDAQRWSAGQRYGLPTQQGGQLAFYEWTAVNGQVDGDEVQTARTFAGSRVAEFGLTLTLTPQPTWRSQELLVRIGAAEDVSTAATAQVVAGWWSNGARDCAPANGVYAGRAQVDAAAGRYRLYLGSTLCAEKPLAATSAPYVFNVAIEGGWGWTALDLAGFRVRAFADPEPLAGPPGAEEVL